MKRSRLAVSVFLFVSALVILGCSVSNNPPFQATGTLTTIQTGDAVNDQIVKFELTISSITLTGVSPTATTGNLLAKPSEIEFVHEAGTLEPLTVAHVPAGTYNGATLSVSNPEVVVVIGTTPTKVPATLSSPTVNVTFANITVGTTPLFINFDLDLANSITLNGTPVTSATVNPKFNVTSSCGTLLHRARLGWADHSNPHVTLHSSLSSLSPVAQSCLHWVRPQSVTVSPRAGTPAARARPGVDVFAWVYRCLQRCKREETVTGAYLASDPHAAKELGEQRRRRPRTVLPFSFIVKRDFYLLRHYPAVV